MANSTGKAFPGAPFRAPPAVIWNNMVDAGQAFADSQLSSAAPPPTRPRATDLIRLRNSSGASRRRGEILKIQGRPIDTVTEENLWLDGVDVEDDCRYGILKQPAANGDIVPAQVSGVCIAKVNITNANHQYALPEEDEFVLQSGNYGPLEILSSPGGTGEKECVVRFASVGGVTVLGPCAAYTPAVELPDTDFETSFPGGCEGPSRYGLAYFNPVTATTTFVPLEDQGGGVFSSDTFTHTCVSTAYLVYVVAEFSSLAIGGVELVFKKDEDNTVVATYQNRLFSWYPNQGGFLQNIGSVCDCVTFAYQLCLSVPTR